MTEDPAGDGLLIVRAVAFAAERHRGQKRKGGEQDPYLDHLVEVMALVAEATEGRDAPLLAAAVLHDVLEDTATERAELEQRFGADAAALVAECTEDPALPKAEQKRRQVVDAPGKSARAKLIKLADKTSNLRALVERPPEAWPPDRRLGYVQWAREVAAGLRGVDPGLEAAFDAAAESAERHMRAGEAGTRTLT